MTGDSDFEPERNARAGDPKTSHDAAGRVEEFGPAIRAQILHALELFGPLAPEQIADLTGLGFAAIWRRCSDLKRDGAVEVFEAGGHVNRSGLKADVLAIRAPRAVPQAEAEPAAYPIFED